MMDEARSWLAFLRRAIGVLTYASVLAASLPGAAAPAQPSSRTCEWPDWRDFKRTMISGEGRVIDASTPEMITTSEGQSYALFFAVVANDRASFDTLLAWTEAHLAGGDLTAHLPAWLWGPRLDSARSSARVPAPASTSVSASPSVPAQAASHPDALSIGAADAVHAGDVRTGGVLDTHPASDADLWIAYALLEAGRLWHERRYTALGTMIARNIVREETASLPGLGRTVLPGAIGFQIAPDVWRLNPSYVPVQVMRGIASAIPDQSEWKTLLATSARLVNETAPRGFSPDWVEYRTGAGFAPDRQTQAQSAYNAIRVYLWAGMLDPADPLRAATLRTFVPLADYVAEHGFPPERIDTQTAIPGPNAGNGGFSAAVTPYLAALGRTDLAASQAARARAQSRAAAPGYYSSVLALFGLGYVDGFYRFDADGRLLPAWTTTCPELR